MLLFLISSKNPNWSYQLVSWNTTNNIITTKGFFSEIEGQILLKHLPPLSSEEKLKLKTEFIPGINAL